MPKFIQLPPFRHPSLAAQPNYPSAPSYVAVDHIRSIEPALRHELLPATGDNAGKSHIDRSVYHHNGTFVYYGAAGGEDASGVVHTSLTPEEILEAIAVVSHCRVSDILNLKG